MSSRTLRVVVRLFLAKIVGKCHLAVQLYITAVLLKSDASIKGEAGVAIAPPHFGRIEGAAVEHQKTTGISKYVNS